MIEKPLHNPHIEDEPLFRSAHSHEFPALISMWQTCFKDTQQAAANIFNLLQKPENIFVMAIDNVPVSMLSIAEFWIVAPLHRCKAAYIYGVATLPEQQGKGLSTKLLNQVDALLKHRKIDCSVLVPAGESLFDFYGKRGYETAFKINKVTINADEIKTGPICKLEPVDADKFMKIRDARFGDSKMFACWDVQYLNYIIEESVFYGGGTYSFTVDNKQICVVCHSYGDTVYIKEIASTFATIDESLRSLKAHFKDAQKFVAYLREDVQTCYKNNILPFAMIKWYDNIAKTKMVNSDGAPPYIAHALD